MGTEWVVGQDVEPESVIVDNGTVTMIRDACQDTTGPLEGCWNYMKLVFEDPTGELTQKYIVDNFDDVWDAHMFDGQDSQTDETGDTIKELQNSITEITNQIQSIENQVSTMNSNFVKLKNVIDLRS